MTFDLFEPVHSADVEPLGEQACVLRGFALPFVSELLSGLEAIQAQAPLRRMVTPGGHTMSAAMSNCGALGWVTDERGYRYAASDPQSGRPWPAMPEAFLRLAGQASQQAGHGAFTPDACLINRYEPGARMSLHQDKNEKDLRAPIVSVSLGIAAVFLFGGHARGDRPRRVPLFHGDVVVWGGVDRMRFHGIAPLKPADHRQLGAQRINLTFRKAG